MRYNFELVFQSGITMAKKVKRRPAKGRRFQNAHRDGSIRTVKKSIEKAFGLPRGSVQLVKRGGARMRADAKVNTLRQHWKSR
jgi:hypothetical protein